MGQSAGIGLQVLCPASLLTKRQPRSGCPRMLKAGSVRYGLSWQHCLPWMLTAGPLQVTYLTILFFGARLPGTCAEVSMMHLCWTSEVGQMESKVHLTLHLLLYLLVVVLLLLF